MCTNLLTRPETGPWSISTKLQFPPDWKTAEPPGGLPGCGRPPVRSAALDTPGQFLGAPRSAAGICPNKRGGRSEGRQEEPRGATHCLL